MVTPATQALSVYNDADLRFYIADTVAIIGPMRTLSRWPVMVAFSLVPLAACGGTGAETLQCGDTITADTRLANDLTCDGDALIIGADDLRLDLDGHTLSGPGPGPFVWPRRALSSVGVRVDAKKGVWIGNGTVSSFATGVLLDNTRDSKVKSVASDGNFYGIYLVDSIGNQLEDNVAKQNIYGIHLQESSGNALIGNCWQSAQVGQIRTREDYYYEELRGSSLRVLL